MKTLLLLAALLALAACHDELSETFSESPTVSGRF